MKWKSLLSVPFGIGLLAGILSTAVAATTMGSSIFRDVPRNAYYDSAVGEMHSLGIIKGYPDGRFGPGDFVSRADVAVMMQRLRNEIKGLPPPSENAGASSSISSSSPASSTASSVSSSSRSASSRSSSTSSRSASDYPQAGGIEFGVPSTSIPESVKSLTLTVERVGGTKGAVSVKYSATGSTATGGQDFTAMNGTITFQDGETRKSITLMLKEDTAAEGPESLRLILSDPSGGAVLGNNPTMVITILDNETANNLSSSANNSSNSSATSVNIAGTFVFSASVYSVEENAGTVTITVNRAGGTNGAANVEYATTKGSASNTTEYTDTSGTLNFAAGEATKIITVQLKDDSNIDGDRNFSIALSAPTGGASLGNPATATVVLVDDENMTTGSGSFKFSASQYKATEGSMAVITIQRVGGTKGTASVAWNIGAGSAVPGPDFTQTTGGTLTFAPGEASKVVLINTFDDGNAESEESAYLNLSNAVGAPLGTLTSATLLISD